ncbi:MAG TPA: ABC transporter permease [Anaerolineales bacterium]|nr:ABC transporter permease [Anaerolineales bacterium]
MIPFLAVVKKELGSVLRDRTILIAILLQLFIASFSSGLLLGMLSLYDADTIIRDSGSWIKIGVVEAADTPLDTILTQRGLTVIPFGTLTQAESAFYEGKVSAIVDTPRDANGITEVKLYLPDSDTVSSLIRMVVQEPLKQYENYVRAQKGVEVHYTDLQGEPSTSFEFVYSVLLPMLMFFPAFVAGSLSIDSLTEEFENNTMQTLLSAPLTVNGMVSAKIASVLILSSLQCGAWLVLLKLNGVAIQNTGWIFLLALIVSGITSTSAALGAVLLKDRERSQFIYALVLLGAAAISNLLNLSPIITLSRLAVGDHFAGGWNVALFAIFLTGLYLLLWKVSHQIIA